VFKAILSTNMINRFIYTFIISLLISCSTAESGELQRVAYAEEQWLGYMNVSEDSIPFRFSLHKSGILTLINAGERITLNPDSSVNDTIFYSFPQYESRLALTQNHEVIQGYWHYYSKGAYRVPFRAQPNNATACANDGQSNKYQVVFSPGNVSSSQLAIGLFVLAPDKCLTGTFLTESGDYRYLQGEQEGNRMWLSCFDGAHLFFFSGNINGDSIVSGKFLSGNHWEEEWCGVKKANAQLQHPDSLTHYIDGTNPLTFNATDLTGKERTFGLGDYRDKVTIVQIFGSWCPNCFDELITFNEINNELADKTLQIIPVAFERSDSLPLAAVSIKKAMSHSRLPFEPFFGGKATKNAASEVFTQLSPISSFPTAIFIGKDGRVRKIHTGFYGPGTGNHHLHYKAELKTFLSSLINE